MVRMSNREEVDRNRLLYDPMVLERKMEERGSNPLDVKLGVKTSAKQYEIRTAIRYWFGGSASHRTSDAIWDRCEAFDNGEWALDENDNIVYDEVGE